MSHFIPNIDNNAVEFMREESVYIDEDRRTKNNSQPISTDQLIGLPNHELCKNSVENGVKRFNSKIKCRKEKDSHWVAEQSIRLRERFDLATGDELVASCSAALLKKILVQGRLYITTHHLFFYTNIFGKVTKEAFSYISLARVEKRRGGLVANAIKLCFADEDVSPIIIGSLNNREKVFSLIQERLQILNPSASEQNVNAGDRIADFSARASLVATASRPFSQNSASAEMFVDDVVISSENDKIEEASLDIGNLKSKSQAIGDNETSKNNTSTPNEQLQAKAEEWLSSLVWRTEDDIIGILLKNSYKKKIERARAVLNAPVKEVFNLLYISDWLKDYHKEVQNYDVDITEWQRDETGRLYRDVLFKRPLGFRLGPKETRVHEKQWISFRDQEGVVIEVQGRNLDVPYSNYFMVHSFFEMSSMNHGKDTQLVASMAVSFSKNTILQGQIESGALSETKTAYGKLVTLAIERVDNEYPLKRVTAQFPKPSIQANQGKTETLLGPDRGVSERIFKAGAQEPESHPSLNGVVGETSTATVEENKLVSSYGVASPGNYNHDSQSVTSDEAVSDTAPKVERADVVYYYMGASLFVIVVACVLLAILVMRVERIISSLQNLIVTLENEVKDRRC